MTPEERTYLINVHIPWARCIAAGMLGRAPHEMDLEDVVGFAVQGLCEAVDAYNPEMGCVFKTFARYRITGAVFDGYRDWCGHTRHHRPTLVSLETGSMKGYEATRCHPKHESEYLSYEQPKYNIIDDSFDYEKIDQINLIKEVLDHLNYSEKEAIILQYFHGCTGPEIADKTGRSVRMQRTIASRARQVIREVFEEYGVTRIGHVSRAA